MVKVKDPERVRLIHGPYRAPKVKPGQSLRCEIRGRLPVVKFSDGRIPWPIAANVNNAGRGSGPYIVCGDLARALRNESSQAIQFWWGVGPVSVTKWRRQLGIPPFNEGSARLWTLWRPAKLRGTTEPVVSFSPHQLRARRVALSLTRKQVAQRMGRAPTFYGQYEEGRRRRATRRTLARIARALRCEVSDLAGGRSSAIAC